MAVIVACAAAVFFAMGAGETPVQAEAVRVPHSAWDVYWMKAGDWLNWGLVAAAPVILAMLWVGDVIRPGSFSRRSQKRDVSGQPAVVWLFAALVSFMSVYFGVGLVTMAAGAAAIGRDAQAAAILNLGATGTGLTAACFMVRLIAQGGDPGRAGLRLRGSDVPFGLGCAALAIPVTTAVSLLGVAAYTWAAGSKPDPIAHETLRLIDQDRWNPWAVVLMATAVFGAAAFEELVYRALFQSAILRATGRAWPSILATAAVFALSHRLSDAPVPWHAIPTLFVLGAAMGLAYERTRRLGVPIVMHAAFNAWNVALLLAGAG